MRADDSVLSDEVSITAYDNGTALVQVPYRRDGDRGLMRVEINGRAVLDAFPARPRKYWNSNYYFTPAEPLGEEAEVRVLFAGDSEETVARMVRVQRGAPAGIALDFSDVTQPELSMKGTMVRPPAGQAGPPGTITARPAPATPPPAPSVPEVTGARTADVPDLTQRPAECAPTAAANSLISLAREHGMDDRLPADSHTMIDELKADMRWSERDGVLPDDFVRGKNEWAVKKGLPVRTDLAGDSQGRGTLEALARSLAAGGAAEVRIRFAEPNGRGGWKSAGGHLITVTGVTINDRGTFIDVNDPRTPEGTETYLVEGNQIVGYPLWTVGPTLVGIGFTQTWTGMDLDPMTDAEVDAIRDFAGEKRLIPVIQYLDYLIPMSEVHISRPDACDEAHWHANAPDHCARDYRGKKVCDPNPSSCGFGKVSEVPQTEVQEP
jgi:hypothetical protein